MEIDQHQSWWQNALKKTPDITWLHGSVREWLSSEPSELMAMTAMSCGELRRCRTLHALGNQRGPGGWLSQHGPGDSGDVTVLGENGTPFTKGHQRRWGCDLLTGAKRIGNFREWSIITILTINNNPSNPRPIPIHSLLSTSKFKLITTNSVWYLISPTSCVWSLGLCVGISSGAMLRACYGKLFWEENHCWIWEDSSMLSQFLSNIRVISSEI